MNTRNYFLIFIVLIVFLFPFSSFAQLLGGEAFLQGDYAEVGVGINGSFGADRNAPSGYHARGGTFYPNRLGFVADVGKDGWTIGTPNYVGDYFVPGMPQEGWDIQVGGIWAKAWHNILGTTFSGGLTGTCTGYTTSGTAQYCTWEGTLGALAIKQVTTQML